MNTRYSEFHGRDLVVANNIDAPFQWSKLTPVEVAQSDHSNVATRKRIMAVNEAINQKMASTGCSRTLAYCSLRKERADLFPSTGI